MSSTQAVHQDRRRKFRRYPARWKVAVVFDTAEGKPVLRTETRDLSIGGAAIVSTHADLTGSFVTLLLARPVRPGAEPPKMIKVRAQVVSSIHVPSMSGYRHGLRFVPTQDDGLSVLAGIISAAESTRRGAAQAEAKPVSRPPPARTAAAAAVQAAPGPATSSGATQAEEEVFNASPGSLLARLREAARAKLQEVQKPEKNEQFTTLVSHAVEMTYRQLKEVTALLNSVKPAYAKPYIFHGLPNFDDLEWKSVHLDFRTKEISPTKKAFEQVTLHYHLAAKKVFSVVRDIPADDRLKRMLEDARIEYSTQQERDSKGAMVGTKFIIPCELKAVLQLVGNFETGRLVLKLRNVEHFGTAEYAVSADAVTEESLRELSQYILGETKHIGTLLERKGT